MAVAQRPSVVLDLDFHVCQRLIYDSPARFRVAATGRRFGKTTLAVGEILAHAATHDGSVCWWVAPTYQQSQIAFRMLLTLVPPAIREANRSDREVSLWNGSRIAFKSGDRFDNLRGEGVSFLVIDEAAYLKHEAWTAALRPTLSDTAGRALLIGTFHGENWFFGAYEYGREAEEWESFRFTTADNPYIPTSEIDEARRTLPSDVFEQEYEASPLVYVGAVFPGEHLQRAVEAGAAYSPGLPTSAGLDWGYTGATALEVCQETPDGAVRWIDETTWRSVELSDRCEAIAETCSRLGVGTVYADAAGATENAALATALRRAGLPTRVRPVPFGKYKEDGITVRRFYLERGQEAISPGCPELIRDSKRYRYKEGRDEVVKEDDHTVDAATAFYASRRNALAKAAA